MINNMKVAVALFQNKVSATFFIYFYLLKKTLLPRKYTQASRLAYLQSIEQIITEPRSLTANNCQAYSEPTRIACRKFVSYRKNGSENAFFKTALNSKLLYMPKAALCPAPGKASLLGEEEGVAR